MTKKIIMFGIPLLFLILAYALPIHSAIMVLLVPFLPFMFILDICFFLAPIAIVLLILWGIVSFFILFRKDKDIVFKKTKVIPIALLTIIVLGCISVEVTGFLHDSDLPNIGLYGE